MWRIEDFETLAVELDLSSSEQGRRAATAVAAGGVRLFNAIELIDVEPAATQIEICESCGIPHCSPGGWVMFRRIGDRVVWLPAWHEMDRGSWEASEYRPPAFLSSRGAPLFGPDCWARLRRLESSLPPCDELPPLVSREAARLCQWEAPGGVLGVYPSEPRVRRDLVLDVIEGDLTAELDAIDRCLRDLHVGTDRMDVVSRDADVRPIVLLLDLPDAPVWKGFARIEGRTGVTVDDGTVLVRGGR